MISAKNVKFIQSLMDQIRKELLGVEEFAIRKSLCNKLVEDCFKLARVSISTISREVADLQKEEANDSVVYMSEYNRKIKNA